MPMFSVDWLYTRERWNPEVVIIFGAAARYHRDTVGRNHDDAHLDNSALHTGAVRPHTGFVENLFRHIAPYGPWQFAIARNSFSYFVYFACVRFLCGGWRNHIFQWARRVSVPRRQGLL
jgi:hypothetical protein